MTAYGMQRLVKSTVVLTLFVILISQVSMSLLSQAETNKDNYNDCSFVPCGDIITEEVTPNLDDLYVVLKGTGGQWVYQGKATKKVSWKKGTSVSSVAIAIATVAPFAGPTGIIAAIGLGTVANIANNSIGGTLTYKMYLYDYLGVQKVKYIWTFKTSSGETLGPYTTIISNN